MPEDQGNSGLNDEGSAPEPQQVLDEYTSDDRVWLAGGGVDLLSAEEIDRVTHKAWESFQGAVEGSLAIADLTVPEADRPRITDLEKLLGNYADALKGAGA